MSRFWTACVLASMIGFAGIVPSRAQEGDHLSEPVDIRPAVSRAKPQPAPARKPASKRAAAKPIALDPATHAEAKPRQASAAKLTGGLQANRSTPKAHSGAPKPAVKAPTPAVAEKQPDPVAPKAAEKPFNIADQITTTAATTAPKPPPVAALPADFCTNIADVAAETRAKIRAEQLAALESDLRTRIGELEAKKLEVQSWVERQEEIRKRADESVLAILGKMKSESAAAQIALMDDAMAAAVLMKLGAKSASAILNDMGAAKAARITESMMAQRVAVRTDGVKSAN